MELKIGQTLQGGKYRIVKTLGQGSFGITYLATTSLTMDGHLGKIDVEVNVAIKEFFMFELNSRSAAETSVEKTDSSLIKNYRMKFRREAENLSKLHHPNIVKVLEVFEENNTTYYVMEFIDGESLDDYIKRKGRLPEDEVRSNAQDICSALSYMHEHKMLHLDLKPKNIMRDKVGHIRLIDFGLSKQYTDNGEPESSTSLGLGTPGYAPIEQAYYKQDGSFPATLDIYALGASIYKMLTGSTPPNATEILSEGFPNELFAKLAISPALTAIVRKAMNPIKNQRYQTIAELREEFDHKPIYTDNTNTGNLDSIKNVSDKSESDETELEFDKNSHEKKEEKSVSSDSTEFVVDFSWKSLFSFYGRNRRRRYWLIMIVTYLFLVIASNTKGFFEYITSLLFIPVIWIHAATIVKRFHDLGRSGWFGLLYLVPFLNLVAFVYLAFFKGDLDDNEYGKSPY